MAQAQRGYKHKEIDTRRKLHEFARSSPAEAELAHKEAMAQGAKCKECPLYGLQQGPVPSEILPNAKLLIIADMPSSTDVKQGRLFTDRAGSTLANALENGGLVREECSVTSAIACKTPEFLDVFQRTQGLAHRAKILAWEAKCKEILDKDSNAELPPEPERTPSPLDCCFPRFKADVIKSNSKVLLAMEKHGLGALADFYDIPYGTNKKAKISQVRFAAIEKQLGAPVSMPDGTIVIANYHPDRGFRKGHRHWLHVIEDYITRSAKIAIRGKTDWVEPPYIINPTVEQVEEVLGRMHASGEVVTIDLETDRGTGPNPKRFYMHTCRIRCIGFGATIDGEDVIICVPIRRTDGTEVWNFEDKKRVIQACMNVLNSNFLYGQNLNFDTSVLLRVGLIKDRRKPFGDSMLEHKNTRDCDLPHNLGFITARFFETPNWKTNSDGDKGYDNLDNDSLAIYNCKDVFTCMKLRPVLDAELTRWGTRDQNEVDLRLAPICRDMGELGLFVDEKQRGELSVSMGIEVKKRRELLQTIVGSQGFNPNSGKHVAAFLFGTKKLVPQLAGKGEAWDKSKEPAVSADALLKLLSKQPCDEETIQFINTMLELRAYSKLKTTYIDNLRVTYTDWRRHGLELEQLPAVMGEVPVKLTTTERVALLSAEDQKNWKSYNKKKKKWLLSSVSDVRYDLQEIIPPRAALSRLSIQYKQSQVAAGRLAASPNSQNWPQRGKVNMLKMITVPPDHILVGADLDQVELRIYAAISRDRILLQAFTEGLDPHTYNAASMFVGKFSRAWKKKVSIRDVYDYLIKLPAKELKSFRSYAKTFCIAEGQRVLTSRGLVPIEKVLRSDKVWDGVEWVSHDGVVYRGKKEVITYDGLTATPDHRVYTQEKGIVELQYGKANGYRIVKTGKGREPIRYYGDSITSCNKGEVSSSDSSLHSMRKDFRDSFVERVTKNRQRRLQNLCFRKTHDAFVATAKSKLHEATLRKFQQSALGALRSPRNSISIQNNSLRSSMDSREPRAAQGFGNRPHRQRWSLRTWKFAMGYELRASNESLSIYTREKLGLQARRLALRVSYCDGEIKSRDDKRANNSRSSRKIVEPQDIRETEKQPKKKARVYDLINAGPRKRFTVESGLTLNCYLVLYGGSPDKLFALMSSLRNKATGALEFPGLKEADVLEWHDNWMKGHPETKKFQDACVDAAKKYGYTASPIGCMRKRFFPGGANKTGATYNMVNQCMPLSSRVLTDQGYLTLAELKNSKEDFTVYVKDRQWAKATIIPKGQANLWRIKDSTGRHTEWSSNHKVRRATDEGYSWVEVRDLQPGDLIAKQPARELEYGTAMNEEDAYWSGYLIGNGAYSNRNYKVVIGNRWHASLFEQVERCVVWARTHGLEPTVEWNKKDPDRAKDDPRSIGSLKEDATHAIVKLHAKHDFCYVTGVTPGDNCYTKNIPKKIWASNLEVRKSFARGYFQADGHINSPDRREPHTTAHTPNYELLRDLQLFMELLGIRSILGKERVVDKKGHTAWTCRFPGHQVYEHLGLGRDSIVRGDVMLPMFEARKLLTRTATQVADAYAARGFSRRSAQTLHNRVKNGWTSMTPTQLENFGVEAEYGWAKVVEVEDLQRSEEVFTLSVDHEDHSYICEGVVSKNSSAAEIANSALIKIADRIPYRSFSEFTGLCLQVHDYIGVIVPEDKEQYAIEVVEEAMNTEVFGIKISATAKASKYWSDQ